MIRAPQRFKLTLLGLVALALSPDFALAARPGGFTPFGGTYSGLLTFSDNSKALTVSGPGTMKIRPTRDGRSAKAIIRAVLTIDGVEIPFKSVFQFQPNGQIRIPAGLFSDPTVPTMRGKYQRNGSRFDYEAHFKKAGQRWTVVGELYRFPKFPGTASITAASRLGDQVFTSFVFNTTPPGL